MEEHLKSYKLTIIYGLILSSTGMYFGIGVGQFNTFFKYFIVEVHEINDKAIQDEIKSNLNLIFIVGGAISCFLSSYLINKGRVFSLAF